MSNNNKNKTSLQVNQNIANLPEPKMKASSLMNIKGKGAATYEGMLDFAHQHGIHSLKSSLIQIPSTGNENTAICGATLLTSDGREFSDIGDASPANTPSGCADHYIRIASTRAKARVLCDAFNIKSTINSNYAHDGQIIDADFTVKERASLPKSQPNPHPNLISTKQIEYIKRLASSQNIGTEELDRISKQKFNNNLNSISTKEAHLMIEHIKNEPA